MSRGRYLLVDGHSVIFAWPDLRELHARSQAGAREALITRLQACQDYTGIRIVLVFDGRGKGSSPEPEPGEVQVFYSDGRKTADDIIERLCAKYCATCDITVATADAAERQTAISFGASCIDPAGLLALLEREERNMQADLARHHARSGGR